MTSKMTSRALALRVNTRQRCPSYNYLISTRSLVFSIDNRQCHSFDWRSYYCPSCIFTHLLWLPPYPPHRRRNTIHNTSGWTYVYVENSAKVSKKSTYGSSAPTCKINYVHMWLIFVNMQLFMSTCEMKSHVK